MQTESTLLQLLFCDFLYLIGFFSLYKAMMRKRTKRKNIYIGIGVLLLICLYSYIGNDYWHYYKWYLENHLGEALSARFWEPVYINLAHFAPSYFVFRLIIWGSAFLLVLLTFRVTKVEFAIALFLFIIRNFLVFSYARVSLAMALMFFGAALFTKIWEKKYLYAIIGIVIVAISLYFHKSAFFGVIVIVLSLLLLKQNRVTFTLLVLLVPVMILLLTTGISEFLLIDLSDNEMGIEKAQVNAEFGVIVRTGGITQIIIDIIWRSGFYLALVMYIKLIIDGIFRKLPTTIRLYANCTALITVIAFMFLAVPSIANYTLYYRFINFAAIPTIIFISYCYKSRIYPKLVNAIYYTSLLSMVLYLLYKTITTNMSI